MRVFLYLRRSTRSLSDISISEPSIEAQKETMLTFADNNYPNIPVTVYQEIVSAKDMTKQRQLKALEDSITNDDILLFYNVSRLSRNITQGVALLDRLHAKKINIFSVAEGISYNDINQKHIMRMALCSAQHEIEQLSARIRHAIKHKKRLGSCFGTPPYGMRAEYQNDIRRFVPDQKEQDSIALIKRMSPQKNPKDIASRLNKHKILKRGKIWTSHKVKTILKKYSTTL
jgi:DNA invertase Pin-like site-specific DNA recombinase